MILGKNCFVKCATHLQFREQKAKIGMGLIVKMGVGTRSPEYSEWTLSIW